MRAFSLEEAEACLPELRKLIDGVLDIKGRFDAKARSLRGLEASDAPPHELAIERAQAQFLLDGLNAWAAKIESLGCVLKGIDPPLVDFPGKLDGRDVYWCWTAGEDSLSHYHGMDEGFSARKPIPASLKKST